ncbi:hypothetical protein AURDEDRAFT_160611 [Auricularia subglabra TFB-10046 SS5]|nr:hypothetical protein AURDEDRAFT_160611 [Auricularia subglabra TFB-10046 SS5]
MHLMLTMPVFTDAYHLFVPVTVHMSLILGYRPLCLGMSNYANICVRKQNNV